MSTLSCKQSSSTNNDIKNMYTPKESHFIKFKVDNMKFILVIKLSASWEETQEILFFFYVFFSLSFCIIKTSLKRTHNREGPEQEKSRG